MEKSPIFKKLIEFIKEDGCLHRDIEDIEMSSSLEYDLGLDSLDVAELTMHMEKHFDIDLPYWRDEEPLPKTIKEFCDQVKIELDKRQA